MRPACKDSANAFDFNGTGAAISATVFSRTSTSSLLVGLTPRDQAILIALDRCPLTVPQLLKLSEIFAPPFTTPRRVRERLGLLALRGLVCRWQYAIPGQGTMNYYTLAPEGYRMLHGPDTPLPGHRAFEPLSPSRLSHTLALAAFIVHTAVAAFRSGFTIADFSREGSLRLQVDTDFLYPDCAFRLETPDGRSIAYFMELDNGTEPVVTRNGNGTFERKMRFYEAFKDRCKAEGLDHRFRVILVSAQTEKRLGHLLTRTAALLHLPHRPLVYGITLTDYCACDVPLTVPCFEDNCGQRRVLVPPAPMVETVAAPVDVGALAPVGQV